MGVTKTIITEGSGPTPAPRQQVSVHYTGWLKNTSAPGNKGDKFDSSLDRGKEFVVPVGVGMVIRGWDEGLATMKVGEKAILDITSDYAYGPNGFGGGIIPGGADLIFEVEMKKIL